MSDWLRVQFYAQLPDGMAVTDMDTTKVAEQLARTFGFSRVDRVAIDQPHSDLPPVRELIDRRPRQAFGDEDRPGHPSRHNTD